MACNKANLSSDKQCTKCNQDRKRGHGTKTHKCKHCGKACNKGDFCSCIHKNPFRYRKCRYGCRDENCQLVHYKQQDKERAKEENIARGKETKRMGCLDMAMRVQCYHSDCYYSHDPADIIELPWLQEYTPQPKKRRRDYYPPEFVPTAKHYKPQNPVYMEGRRAFWEARRRPTEADLAQSKKEPHVPEKSDFWGQGDSDY